MAVRTGIVAAFVGSTIWFAGQHTAGGPDQDLSGASGTVSATSSLTGDGFGWDSPTPDSAALDAGDGDDGFGWDLLAPAA